jgi:hypothetical protein
MLDLDNGAWRDIAEQASRETDSEKLNELVAKLCDELDGERKPTASVGLQHRPQASVL